MLPCIYKNTNVENLIYKRLLEIYNYRYVECVVKMNEVKNENNKMNKLNEYEFAIIKFRYWLLIALLLISYIAIVYLVLKVIDLNGQYYFCISKSPKPSFVP